MVYASATRGFRRSGCCLRGNPIFELFDAEEVTAFEVGYKSELMDGLVRLNAAALREQVQGPAAHGAGRRSGVRLVQSTFDVADATIQGIELDVVAQVTDHLVPTAGYGYTDATYDSAVTGFDKNPGLRARTGKYRGRERHLQFQPGSDRYAVVARRRDLHRQGIFQRRQHRLPGRRTRWWMPVSITKHWTGSGRCRCSAEPSPGRIFSVGSTLGASPIDSSARL